MDLHAVAEVVQRDTVYILPISHMVTSYKTIVQPQNQEIDTDRIYQSFTHSVLSVSIKVCVTVFHI